MTRDAFASAGAWRTARALAYAHRYRLALGLALLLVGRLAVLVQPWMSGYVVDDVIGDGRGDLLLPLALLAIVAALIQSGAGFALSLVLAVPAERAVAELRKRAQRHVTRLPVGYFDATRSGVLISRVIRDAEGVQYLVGNDLARLAGGLLIAVLGLGVLFWLDWRLTAAILGILVVFTLSMVSVFLRLRPLQREQRRITAEVIGRLAEMLSGVRVVKAYSVERREQRVFAEGAHRMLRNKARIVTHGAAASAAATLAIGVIGALMIYVGANSVTAGQWSMGDLLRYLLFSGVALAPMLRCAVMGVRIASALAGLDRLHELLATSTELEDDAARRPVGRLAGRVTLERVTFAYSAGKPVLVDVSLDAPAGSTTALVGSSGSGKSTLVSLIVAFNRPQAGCVRVDGQDLARLKLADYRRQLGVVLQDNVVFDGTVAENIAFARPRATRAEIEAVGRAAHCDEFVRGFPDRYDTVIGERGVRLSGGQRQRVAIARALLADPRILILDEATSSLDSESEAMIRNGLRTLRRGRTTFVIAHRLSTIRSADQIVVLEHGRIVERGTHGALLAAGGGRYHELYDMQRRLEQDSFVNPGENRPSPCVP